MSGPVLAIETSCDDTCAAVVDGRSVLSSVVSSQADLHEAFGGVVPEVASRRHLELSGPVVDRALREAGVTLDDVRAIAVTRGPGLIGALLVGLQTAKALASPRRLPLVPVDHLHGHVAANSLDPDPLDPPFLCLIASGGHTMLVRVTEPGPLHGPNEVIGQTLDDAAGEALDKGARLLGLGYPGGAAIDRLASEGDPEAFDFPVARPGRLDFSFSGVKTSLLYRVGDLGPDETERRRADLCASYQRAVVDQLLDRVEAAIEGSTPALALGGGVAANSELRRRAGELCERHGLRLKVPPRSLCTDNAAMIAAAAASLPEVAWPEYLGVEAVAAGAPA